MKRLGFSLRLPANFRSLRFEQLEDRQMLSVTVDVASRAAWSPTTAGGDTNDGAVTSADGRYIAFASTALNWANGWSTYRGESLESIDDPKNVYRYDRQTGVIELVSINAARDGLSNGKTSSVQISADGRVVLFVTSADNIDPRDVDQNYDVYTRDMDTGVVQLVSVNAAGTGSANQNIMAAELSADGSVAVFTTTATNLDPLDTNTIEDVYARDLTAGVTRLVSINQSGTAGGNASSPYATVSGDGNRVAFASFASNLHPKDTNGQYDVFVRDLEAGTTGIVSMNAAGTASSNGGSGSMSMSADGSRIAFASSGSDLVPLDTNGANDVFIWDAATKTTRLASKSRIPLQPANGGSWTPVISDNGSVIVFGSRASNLDLLDTDDYDDLYYYDVPTDSAHLINVNESGTGSGTGFIYSYQINAEGTSVAFSGNEAITPTPAYGRDVYVRDLRNGTTRLISRNVSGAAGDKGNAELAAFSADGQLVLFTTDATDVVEGDENRRDDLFMYDVSVDHVELLSKVIPGRESVTANGSSFVDSGAMSADGRYIAFVSDATNLVSGFEFVADVFNVYRYDRLTGQVVLVSVNAAGNGGGNRDSGNDGWNDDEYRGPSISADGSRIAFISEASNLDPLDTDSWPEVFVRDLSTNTTQLVSINQAGTGGGAADSESSLISANGRVVVFRSESKKLHELDHDNDSDIYARDLETQVTHLVSINQFGTAGGNKESWRPVVSADGMTVAFASEATNLVPNITATYSNVYVRNLVTGVTSLVSVNSAGTGGGNYYSWNPAISADGNVIAFMSEASNLHPLKTTGEWQDIFARNMLTGETQLVSVNFAGTQAGNRSSDHLVISANGRVVAYVNNSTNMGPLDTDTKADIYAFDLELRTSYLVSNDTTLVGGTGSDYGCYEPSISGDGNTIVFVAIAGNRQVLARDLTNGETTLISENTDGTTRSHDVFYNPVISEDGRAVAYHGNADDLVFHDYNGFWDVFVTRIDSPSDSMPGDFNQNGTVDSADYTLWRNNRGQTSIAAFSGADGDGDGQIDWDDYLVWKKHYGQSRPVPGTGAGLRPLISSQSAIEVATPAVKQQAIASAADETHWDMPNWRGTAAASRKLVTRQQSGVLWSPSPPASCKNLYRVSGEPSLKVHVSEIGPSRTEASLPRDSTDADSVDLAFADLTSAMA